MESPRSRKREEEGLPLETVEPRRLYRQIADQLRQLMDQGEYPVGSRLPAERELAERMGVSRPTVREALIALEVEGRLKIRVGSGIYVLDQQSPPQIPTNGPIEGPLELLRARAFVESAVAEEAAARANAADIARLDQVLLEVEQAHHTGDELIGLDRRFHIAISATLENAVLTRFVGEMFDLRINPMFEQLARHVETDSTWQSTHQEHIAIRDAIAASDRERARAAMRRHLEEAHRRFSQDFRETPLAAAGAAGRKSRARISA
jgi:DNA-binding FadR family transcriptional regulator